MSKLGDEIGYIIQVKAIHCVLSSSASHQPYVDVLGTKDINAYLSESQSIPLFFISAAPIDAQDRGKREKGDGT